MEKPNVDADSFRQGAEWAWMNCREMGINAMRSRVAQFLEGEPQVEPPPEEVPPSAGNPVDETQTGQENQGLTEGQNVDNAQGGQSEGPAGDPQGLTSSESLDGQI